MPNVFQCKVLVDMEADDEDFEQCFLLQSEASPHPQRPDVAPNPQGSIDGSPLRYSSSLPSPPSSSKFDMFHNNC